MPSAGVFRQMIYSLNVDSGATNIGWPVSVEGLVSGTAAFTSQVQGERGALAIVGDRVYVPYGGAPATAALIMAGSSALR
jgi:hypothetical protein